MGKESEIEALERKLAYEKDLSIRAIECAARIGHAMEDCLAAMGRAYDKLEWMKGEDVVDCQSQIKAAGERGRVALMGFGKPSVRPHYMCAARISNIHCDLVNGHEGLHCKFGQIADTTIWWVIGDADKAATASSYHKVNKPVAVCDACGGEGEIGLEDGDVSCHKCGGSGDTNCPGPFKGKKICPTCEGEVKFEIIDGKCKACRLGVVPDWAKGNGVCDICHGTLKHGELPCPMCVDPHPGH